MRLIHRDLFDCEFILSLSCALKKMSCWFIESFVQLFNAIHNVHPHVENMPTGMTTTNKTQCRENKYIDNQDVVVVLIFF